VKFLKVPAIFLILALCASSGICSIASDQNRKGIERLNQGKYREAIIYFEYAHQSDPENATIRSNLSTAYHSLSVKRADRRDWYDAIQNEKQALRHTPDSDNFKKQLGIFYNNYALEYIERKRYGLAKDNLNAALRYDPGSETIRTNLYNVILQEAEDSLKNNNEYKASLLAQDAISLLPENANAYLFAGNLYYQQDEFEDALSFWAKALELDPQNEQLKKMIVKLRREKDIEGDFKTKKRLHFKIRFERGADSEYIWTVSDILEDGRRTLRSEFNLYSEEIIPVVVYTGRQFKEATVTSHWTLGLYDGKIRLNEHDIARGDDALRRTLYHEYGHAVLFLTYGPNIPMWLHEGFAQFNEPEQLSSTSDNNFLRNYLKKHGAFSLESLEEMLKQKKDIESTRAAYLESKLFVAYLIDKYRKYKIKRLLETLKQGKNWQEALVEVYHKNTAQFDEDFNKHLDCTL